MGSSENYESLLECIYHWEKNDPDRSYMTQPLGEKENYIKSWTWMEAVDEARRIASYLISLDLPEKSHIAICSKNCAH